MNIKFRCDFCFHEINVSNALAGRMMKCPKCGVQGRIQGEVSESSGTEKKPEPTVSAPQEKPVVKPVTNTVKSEKASHTIPQESKGIPTSSPSSQPEVVKPKKKAGVTFLTLEDSEPELQLVLPQLDELEIVESHLEPKVKETPKNPERSENPQGTENSFDSNIDVKKNTKKAMPSKNRMKIIVFFVSWSAIIVVCFGVALWIAMSIVLKDAPAKPEIPLVAPPVATWQNVEEPGHFKCEMPGPAIRKDAITEKVHNVVFVYRRKLNEEFAVIYSHDEIPFLVQLLPKQKILETFLEVVTKSLQKFNPVITSSVMLKDTDFPTLAVDCNLNEIQGGKVRLRIMLINNRFYVLSILSGYGDIVDSEAERFFSSFKPEAIPHKKKKNEETPSETDLAQSEKPKTEMPKPEIPAPTSGSGVVAGGVSISNEKTDNTKPAIPPKNDKPENTPPKPVEPKPSPETKPETKPQGESKPIPEPKPVPQSTPKTDPPANNTSVKNNPKYNDVENIMVPSPDKVDK